MTVLGPGAAIFKMHLPDDLVSYSDLRSNIGKDFSELSAEKPVTVVNEVNTNDRDYSGSNEPTENRSNERESESHEIIHIDKLGSDIIQLDKEIYQVFFDIVKIRPIAVSSDITPNHLVNIIDKRKWKGIKLKQHRPTFKDYVIGKLAFEVLDILNIDDPTNKDYRSSGSTPRISKIRELEPILKDCVEGSYAILEVCDMTKLREVDIIKNIIRKLSNNIRSMKCLTEEFIKKFRLEDSDDNEKEQIEKLLNHSKEKVIIESKKQEILEVCDMTGTKLREVDILKNIIRELSNNIRSIKCLTEEFFKKFGLKDSDDKEKEQIEKLLLNLLNHSKEEVIVEKICQEILDVFSIQNPSEDDRRKLSKVIKENYDRWTDTKRPSANREYSNGRVKKLKKHLRNEGYHEGHLVPVANHSYFSSVWQTMCSSNFIHQHDKCFAWTRLEELLRDVVLKTLCNCKFTIILVYNNDSLKPKSLINIVGFTLNPTCRDHKKSFLKIWYIFHIPNKETRNDAFEYLADSFCITEIETSLSLNLQPHFILKPIESEHASKAEKFKFIIRSHKVFENIFSPLNVGEISVYLSPSTNESGQGFAGEYIECSDIRIKLGNVYFDLMKLKGYNKVNIEELKSVIKQWAETDDSSQP